MLEFHTKNNNEKQSLTHLASRTPQLSKVIHIVLIFKSKNFRIKPYFCGNSLKLNEFDNLD